MPMKEAIFSEKCTLKLSDVPGQAHFPGPGDVLLTEVSPAMIAKLLVDFQRAGYAHATAVKLYNILNGVFEMAFLDDSIPANPMLKVKRPAPRKGEQPKEEADKAYTVEELHYIFSCAAQEPLQWQTYISLAADTGLRRGELCGLQWADIDFKAGAVTVRRTCNIRPLPAYATSPKNGKVRVVDGGRCSGPVEGTPGRTVTILHFGMVLFPRMGRRSQCTHNRPQGIFQSLASDMALRISTPTSSGIQAVLLR